MKIGRDILLLIVLLITGAVGWHYWQGPSVAGYRLEMRPLVQQVVASGVVASQSVAEIGSEMIGVIATRNVQEGDTVQIGDVLLTLHDNEYQAHVQEADAALQLLIKFKRPGAQAALTDTQTELEQASRERQRRERLLATRAISTEQLEQARQTESTAKIAVERAQFTAASLAKGGAEETVLFQRLEAARASLAKTRIHAQVAGIVLRRHVEPGDLVQPGHALLDIARLDSSEILMPLDEKNLAPVALGQSAWVIADAYPERPLGARISFIAPTIDTTRGTIDVHLELLTAADFLRQGMTVSVTIETARREQVLVTPNDALHQRNGLQAEVFRVRNSVVERVPVQLGLLGIDASEVIQGLKTGDAVLIDKAEVGQRVRFRAQPIPGGPAL